MNPRTEPIRVMILVDKFDYHGTYINGPSRYFSWVVPRFNRGRVEPFLCALRDAGRSDTIFRNEGIPVQYFGLHKYNPTTLQKIMRFVRDNGIDLLHLTGYGSTTFGRLAARGCGKPSIVHEHWVDPGIGKSQQYLEKILSPYTDWAIAISETAKRFLVEKKYVREDRIVTIPNGIPLERFIDIPEEAIRNTREQLGIPSRSPVVGIVGMFHEVKGHRYFLEAALSVARSFPDAVFLIVGDGELRNTLERQTDELSLRGNVRFLGQREDIPKILRVMDVYVCSSLSETFSLSLLEAMASHRAIVTTDCGGPSEMIRQGWSGVVVPVRDPEAMAAEISLLLRNTELRMTLGRNAAQDAKRFDIRNTVNEIESLYERACFPLRIEMSEVIQPTVHAS